MFAQARDVGYIHTPDEGDEVHGVYAHARVGGLLRYICLSVGMWVFIFLNHHLSFCVAACVCESISRCVCLPVCII